MAAPQQVEAEGPTYTRRHATGAESARSLLFTVLGELVLRSGGRAWTSAFIDVLGRLGVEEKAARQALMRTGGDGWLRSERSGRRTVWHLTPAAETLLREGTERIFGFTAVAHEWDGAWTLVLARAPETDRRMRHLLRSRMNWAGFGNPAPGVWISPGGQRAGRAADVLAEAGVTGGQVFTASHADGEIAQMIDQAWDLSTLAAGYDAFVDRFSGPAPRDRIARVVDLVHEWRRFPWLDPGLPAEYLPHGWSGTRAARLFARLHGRWLEPALDEWRGLAS